jgi:hypothetical protein
MKRLTNAPRGWTAPERRKVGPPKASKRSGPCRPLEIARPFRASAEVGSSRSRTALEAVVDIYHNRGKFNPSENYPWPKCALQGVRGLLIYCTRLQMLALDCDLRRSMGR